MSSVRRHRNPGKRERQAGKRHRRAVVISYFDGAVHGPLKVGRKHSGRIWRRVFELHKALAVSDAENSVKGSEESVRQSALE